MLFSKAIDYDFEFELCDDASVEFVNTMIVSIILAVDFAVDLSVIVET